MKYMLMCLGALVVSFGVGWVPARWIGKKNGHTFVLTLLFGVLLLGAVSFGYLESYYHADSEAVAQALANPTVKTEKIDGGYFFDGPGEAAALIFYPGAKVETIAYAPLMTLLAEQGVDCFLADMPFRMAMFGAKLGDRFLANYSYDTWIAAGHSMGGLVVSGFADRDEIDALVLLGAYPGGQVRENLHFLSIYGTNDGCLNRSAYESAKAYWPAGAEEHPIAGGNHAQYAAYGPQSGDGEAEITMAEQQQAVAEIILAAVNGIE